MLKRLANKLKPKANGQKKDAEMHFMLDGMIEAVSGRHPFKPEDEAKEIIEFMQDCKKIEKNLASKELALFQSKVKTYIDEEERFKGNIPRLRFLNWVNTAYKHFSGEENILFGANREFGADPKIIERILHYTHDNDQTRLLSTLLYSRKYSIFAKSKLQEIAFAEFLKLLNQLIHENPAEVIEILKQRPALKNIRGSVVDQFGILYENVTFYEAALYFGDARILRRIESCYSPVELNGLKGKKFLTYVLQGNEKAVKTMLDAAPSLLNYRGTAHDRTGRIYKDVTGYQAAFLCADFQMMRMIEGYFTAEEDKLSKRQTLFPNSNIENALKNQPDFNFTDIVDAIDKAEPDAVEQQLKNEINKSALCQEMNKFRDDFKQISLNEVLVNLKHLKKAYKIHEEKFDDWDWNKRDLFFRQVIGFVQAISLPENIKQIYHQGLWDYTEFFRRGDIPINKRLGGFKNSEDFKGSLHLSSGVGFNYGGWHNSRMGRTGAGVSTLLGFFMSNIHIELTRLMQTAYSHPQQSVNP